MPQSKPCTQHLKNSKKAKSIYTRDFLTANDLTLQLKKKVSFLGNPFMDKFFFRDKELKKTSAARNQRYKSLHTKTGDGNVDVNETNDYENLKKKIGSKEKHDKPAFKDFIKNARKGNQN